MTTPTRWLAMALTIAPVSALADPNTDNMKTYAYYTSVTAPRVAEACAKRLPDYRKSFDPAFVRWKERLGKEIAEGKAMLEARDANGGKNMEQIEAGNAQGEKEFATRSDAEVQAICDKNLRVVEVN